MAVVPMQPHPQAPMDPLMAAARARMNPGPPQLEHGGTPQFFGAGQGNFQPPVAPHPSMPFPGGMEHFIPHPPMSIGVPEIAGPTPYPPQMSVPETQAPQQVDPNLLLQEAARRKYLAAINGVL